MAITETLALADKVSGPAKVMAAGVDRLAASTGKARSGLARLGSAGKALAPIAPSARSAAKMQDRFGASVWKARQAMLKEHAAAKFAARSTRQLGAESKSAAKAGGKLGSKDALGALGLGGAIGAGILTAASALSALYSAAVGATKAAAGLVAEFARGVVEAHLLRGRAKALQDTLSGGRGAKVLAAIKQQAIATGQSMADLQKNTTAARDAGVNYGDAFKLNMLRGDIIESGRSADTADAAINEMLTRVKSGSITAAQGQAELAKKFRVAGDGAKAASAASKTLGGALNRLKAAPGRIFDAIAEKAGPTLDKMGASISKFLVEANKSGKVKELINGLAAAFNKLVAGIGIAAAIAGPLWDGLKQGISPLLPELKKLGEALDSVFGGESSEGMAMLGAAAKLAGQAIGFFAGQAIRTAIGFAAIITGGAMLVGWLSTLPARATAAAQGLISGLVGGIKSGIGRAVEAVKELAAKLTSAFDFKLEIGSPSKLFRQRGRWTAQGAEEGIYDGIPGVEAAGRDLAAAPMATAATPASAPGASRGGKGGDFHLTLQVSALPGATQEDGQSLAAGIVPVIRREIASWLETQLTEAGA